jgi:hypothetical protein
VVVVAIGGIVGRVEEVRRGLSDTSSLLGFLYER